MAIDEKSESPERERTDESLRIERQRTDRALAERQAVAEDADMAVHRARESADAVVIAARDKADQGADQTGPHVAPRAAIVEARVAEDAALRDERASADESLRRERDENARALSTLLPLERDRTDRFLLTERARSDDAVSNRDDFLGIASHDLRNLLGGIVMSAGLLSKRASENDEGKQILIETQRIQRYAARMNKLIGDLVDVASIDAGQLAVTPAQGDATRLIAEAVDTFQAAASEKGISLVMESVESSLLAEFDHDRLLQVLANLITNAVKFTPHGGSIRVRGERAGDELRFSISDSGSGIPSHMLEAVFERFWQVGRDDRRGVGLGLYISRCVVEAHGGKIWADSNLGEGSTFHFTVPRAATGLKHGAE